MSDREVATYLIDSFLKDLESKVLSPDFFDSCEFNEFMGRNYPTLNLTVIRKKKLTEHFVKLMDRARRPIKTTLATYSE